MVSVTIAGTDRTCDVIEPVKISIGRQSIRDQGRPSHASLELNHVGALVRVGQAVKVADEYAARFTGYVSDNTAQMTDDATELAQTATLIGLMADWQGTTIGAEAWPQEQISARAHRIAAAVGLPLVIETPADELVIARAAEPAAALEILQQLADSTGGWLYDDPAGVLHLQTLSSRSDVAQFVRWSDEPEAETWAQLDDTLTWADDDALRNPAIVVPCGGIEWQPRFVETLQLVNSCTVEYGAGSPRPSVTLTDQESIDAFTLYPLKIDSQLVTAADAWRLASAILGRASRPRYVIDSVDLLWDELTPALRDRIAHALPGSRITLTGIDAPVVLQSAYPGVLEGWDETLEADSRGITLYLSHIEASFPIPTWRAEPDGATWDQLDPAMTWEEDLT